MGGRSVQSLAPTRTLSRWSPLFPVAPQVIRLFLERGPNKEELCNARDADSKTPFDLAMQNKHTAVVKLLKEMGDPNAQSAACLVM